MTDEITDPLCGMIGVEFQPTLVPRPIGYGVKVDGKMVAFLTPEAVEAAYLEFQAMAELRNRHDRVLRGGQPCD